MQLLTRDILEVVVTPLNLIEIYSSKINKSGSQYK